MQGETDSERFFALMTVAIREHEGDVRAGIIATTKMLARDITLYSFNFLLAAPGHLWAFRYPEHNDLWLLARAPGGPRGRGGFRRARPHRTRLEVRREIILDEPPHKPLSLTGRAADSQAQEH